MKVKHERLFIFFCPREFYAKPTRKGRTQFVMHQSTGQLPDTPDDFYRSLSLGKKRFDLLCREYQQMFATDEWWGFAQLRDDWKQNLWVLPHLCRWYVGDLGI